MSAQPPLDDVPGCEGPELTDDLIDALEQRPATQATTLDAPAAGIFVAVEGLQEVALIGTYTPATEVSETLRRCFVSAVDFDDIAYRARIQQVVDRLSLADRKSPNEKQVRKLAAEIRKAAEARKKQAREAERVANPDWTDALTRTKANDIAGTRHNALETVRHCDDEIASSLAWDKIREQPYITGPLPWNNRTAQRELKDSDLGEIASWFERNQLGQYSPKSEELYSAVMRACHDRPFNRAKEDFERKEWDGAPRIALALEVYLGACKEQPGREAAESEEDFEERVGEFRRYREYVASVSQKFFIAMAKRVYEPGCKVDNLLVLRGPQGGGKSTFCGALAPGGADYFGCDMPPIDSKDAKQYISTKTLVELAELAATKKSETEAVKAFITTCSDKFRAPYDKLQATHPRQCVFIATTNKDEFLVDDTGNRRFWIVDVEGFDAETFARDRAQLLAEALILMKQGVPHWFVKGEEDQLATAREMQSAAEKHDPWHEKVEAFVSGKTWTTTNEILDHIGLAGSARDGSDINALPICKRAQPEANRIASIMSRLGWTKRQKIINGLRTRGFEAPRALSGGAVT